MLPYYSKFANKLYETVQNTHTKVACFRKILHCGKKDLTKLEFANVTYKIRTVLKTEANIG